MSAAAAELVRRAPAGTASDRDGLGLRLVAFFSLAAFAAVRYSDLIAKPPAGRVVIVAACVTAGCGLLAASGRLPLRGPAVTLGRVLLVLGTFAVSMLALRIPAHLLAPGQWRHLAGDLSGGADQLGDWLWPYRGGDRWAQAAVLLPVPVVLLAAGCSWFWPSQRLLATRRTLALAAILAIFVTGTANSPASVPAFDGFVLMALVAATLLLPLSAASETGRALWWLAVCAAGALAVQGAFRSDGPWIHYRDQAGAAAATAGVSFQWAQLYGPDRLPRSQAPVLVVSEPRPELLRLTSLDRFDGLRFLRSSEPAGSSRFDLPAGARDGSWTERATIEIRALRSSILATGGGLATRIRSFDEVAPAPAAQRDATASTPGVAPSGASYEVLSYDPRPSAERARRAPPTFPRAYLPYAQFYLPGAGASALAPPDLTAEAQQAPAGSRLVGPSAPGQTPAADPAKAALITASPYGPMFALARGLAAGAASDYDVAVRIQRYLSSQYGYDKTVPLTRYPLEAFLFSQRRGYCQQFSGAMALMLRMNGIPARIGVGFLPAARGPRKGTWQIRASDAHAWVEVFFSGIGWVSFDPTPPIAAGASQEEATALSRATVFGAGSTLHRPAGPSGKTPGRVHGRHGGSSDWPLIALVLGGVLALAGAAYVLLRARVRSRDSARPVPGEDPAVTELRRALTRLGRAEPGMTLAQLERRLAREGHAEAAGYVKAIGERRFGAGAGEARRRAGRRQLRAALAPSGRIADRARALAALPPAWRARPARGR